MKFLAAIIGFCLFASTAAAQRPDTIPFHTGFPGEPIRGYFQPVMIRTPTGTCIAGTVNGQFSDRLAAPFQAGLLVGCDYRLRITDIPFHSGKELFPTVTVIARTYPPQGRELDFPIVIDLTFEDLELALEGRYITRIIYLENPKNALPIQAGDDEQISHDVHGTDPIAVAATRGLPVAIVRIGGRIPNQNGDFLDPAFCFGSPPWKLSRTLPPEHGIAPPNSNQQNALNSLAIDPALKSAGESVIERQQQQTLPNTWRPPNIAGRNGWHSGEYLLIGGDAQKPAYVDDWTVYNFGTEDTIAHFDTLDGRTIAEPSNKVHIYAPRFGAIRKIEGLLNEGQVTGLVETRNRQILTKERNAIQTGYAEQETKTQYARLQDQLNSVDGRRKISGMDSSSALSGYDNFQAVDSESMMLRQRIFDLGGSARTQLERGALNARAWMGLEAVKVQINELAPMEATGIEGAAVYFQVDDKRSKSSKLRLIKVASKETALPGEIIELTLRFDNVGSEVIGNITILDNLTARLEFLPGSAVCSLKSGFVVERNESGSFTLRFEITDPLSPGEFGVIQFQCRVR